MQTNVPHIILDIETTGFRWDGGDEIVELAGERLVGGVVVDTFHSYMTPFRPVPLDASRIHGLTTDFLREQGVPPRVALQQFADFIGNGIWVGHNVRRFDYPFVAYAFEEYGVTYAKHPTIVDTLELARQHLKLPNYRLGSVAMHFGINSDGAHRAGRDVEITREVFLKLSLH
ncbi:MAG: 3'-5' exonuclease [Patescibacteria group bacterium]|jgi:DNA polymerase III epsilon subunit family exonuclease